MKNRIDGTLHVEVEQSPERGYIRSKVPVGTAQVNGSGHIEIALKQILCAGTWYRLPTPFVATLELRSSSRAPSPSLPVPSADVAPAPRRPAQPVCIIDRSECFEVSGQTYRIWRQVRAQGPRWGLDRWAVSGCAGVGVDRWVEVLRTEQESLLEHVLLSHMPETEVSTLFLSLTVGGV